MGRGSSEPRAEVRARVQFSRTFLCPMAWVLKAASLVKAIHNGVTRKSLGLP